MFLPDLFTNINIIQKSFRAAALGENNIGQSGDIMAGKICNKENQMMKIYARYAFADMDFYRKITISSKLRKKHIKQTLNLSSGWRFKQRVQNISGFGAYVA